MQVPSRAMRSRAAVTFCCWFTVAMLSTFSLSKESQAVLPVQDGPGERKISLHTSAPLRSILEDLFRSQAASCVIGPGVEGTVTVHFDNVPFEDALTYLLTSASPELTYSRDKNNVYVVRMKEKLSNVPIVNVTNQGTGGDSSLATAVILSGIDPVTDALQMQLMLLEARRAALRVELGEENPALLQVNRQIVSLQRALYERRRAKVKPAVARKPVLPAKAARPIARGMRPPQRKAKTLIP